MVTRSTECFDIINGTKGKLGDFLLAPEIWTIQGEYDAITDLSKSFQFKLTALVQDQDARIVTNPHVAVRSGKLRHNAEAAKTHSRCDVGC